MRLYEEKVADGPRLHCLADASNPGLRKRRDHITSPVRYSNHFDVMLVREQCTLSAVQSWRRRKARRRAHPKHAPATAISHDVLEHEYAWMIHKHYNRASFARLGIDM